MSQLPSLKRVTINSELELDIWLKKNPAHEEPVMLVTHTNESHKKYLSRGQVREMLGKHGWKTESRYNIGSNLLGHVVSKDGA